MDTWRIWELVLPTLERHHDVLAPTLPGHAGGPPLDGEPSAAVMVDTVERAMDEAGLETAHVAGNSMGGFAALHLPRAGAREAWWPSRPPAAGPRATTPGAALLASQAGMHEEAIATAPHAQAIVASAEGRRRATQLIVEELCAHAADLHRPPAAGHRALRGAAGR